MTHGSRNQRRPGSIVSAHTCACSWGVPQYGHMGAERDWQNLVGRVDAEQNPHVYQGAVPGRRTLLPSPHGFRAALSKHLG